MVTSLGRQDLILDLTWLRECNPKIDWEMTEVRMSHCPNHCWTCQTEANDECKARIVEAEKVHACRAGPMPLPDIEMDDIPDFVTDLDDEDDDEETEGRPPVEDDQLEEGDRLFATTVPCEAEFILATSN